MLSGHYQSSPARIRLGRYLGLARAAGRCVDANEVCQRTREGRDRAPRSSRSSVRCQRVLVSWLLHGIVPSALSPRRVPKEPVQRTTLTLAEQIGDSFLQRFEVGADTCPNYGAVRIDGLSVPAASRPGANRAEETAFGKDPRSVVLRRLNEAFLNESAALGRNLVALAGSADHPAPTLRDQLGVGAGQS